MSAQLSSYSERGSPSFARTPASQSWTCLQWHSTTGFQLVYLTLEYGGSRDSGSIPDSYPAVVRVTFDGDSVEITDIEVDTGSFYE